MKTVFMGSKDGNPIAMIELNERELVQLGAIVNRYGGGYETKIADPAKALAEIFHKDRQAVVKAITERDASAAIRTALETMNNWLSDGNKLAAAEVDQAAGVTP